MRLQGRQGLSVRVAGLDQAGQVRQAHDAERRVRAQRVGGRPGRGRRAAPRGRDAREHDAGKDRPEHLVVGLGRRRAYEAASKVLAGYVEGRHVGAFVQSIFFGVGSASSKTRNASVKGFYFLVMGVYQNKKNNVVEQIIAIIGDAPEAGAAPAGPALVVRGARGLGARLARGPRPSRQEHLDQGPPLGVRRRVPPQRGEHAALHRAAPARVRRARRRLGQHPARGGGRRRARHAGAAGRALGQRPDDGLASGAPLEHGARAGAEAAALKMLK